MIGSYADWKPGSEQCQWLERDLMAFNRSRTPWLVAAFHSPWYAKAHMPCDIGICRVQSMSSRSGWVRCSAG